MEISNQEIGNNTEDNFYFEEIHEGIYIMHGFFNQASKQFPTYSRNKQCTANAAVAIAYSALKPLEIWSPSDLDIILTIGNDFYIKSNENLPKTVDYLATDELLDTLTIDDKQIHLNIEADIIVGLVSSFETNDVPETFFSSLEEGLKTFFTDHTSCIIACATEIAISALKSNDFYYLFDSHPRGPKGYPASYRSGTCVLMKFNQLSLLCRHVKVSLEARGIRSFFLQFSISKIVPEIVLLTSDLMQMEVKNQEIGNNTEDNFYFEEIQEGIYIMHGFFNQASKQFPRYSRNKQCTANAAVAIAFSVLKPLENWSPLDLDNILLIGNDFYIKSVGNLQEIVNYLATDELLDTLTIDDKQIRLNIEADIIVGLVNSLETSDVPETFFSSLEEALKSFFTHHSSGIITCSTNISISVFKWDDLYYLFDSHPRGPKGYPASDKNGTCVLMKFNHMSLLCRHVKIALEAQHVKNSEAQFSISNTAPEVIH